MLNEPGSVGTFVQVYIVENGGRYHVLAEHWDEIDAAYHNWVERRIDRVLSLSGNDGAPLMLSISRVAEVCLCSPESRRRDNELAAALKAEAGFVE